MYFLVLLVCRIIAVLPWRVIIFIGTTLGWVMYFGSRRHRQRIKENLQQAGYSHYLKKAAAESGRCGIEIIWLWFNSPARIGKLVKIEGWEKLAESEGKGIVMLSPHFGGFEIVPRMIVSRGLPSNRQYPIVAMYRPPKQKIVEKIMWRGRFSDPRIQAASADVSGIKRLLSILKKGDIVGVLPDQVPKANQGGVWANFFNKPAYTMTLAAKLSQVNFAVEVLWFCVIRQKDGYLCHINRDSELLPGSTCMSNAPTVEESVANMNRSIEILIRHAPWQYNWAYNRYKTV